MRSPKSRLRQPRFGLRQPSAALATLPSTHVRRKIWNFQRRQMPASVQIGLRIYKKHSWSLFDLPGLLDIGNVHILADGDADRARADLSLKMAVPLETQVV